MSRCAAAPQTQEAVASCPLPTRVRTRERADPGALQRAVAPIDRAPASAQHSLDRVGIHAALHAHPRIVRRAARAAAAPEIAGLSISRPDAPAEREAERVAAAVLRMPEPASEGSTGRADHAAVHAGARTTPSLGGRLGTGQPLPAAVRSWYEPRLGVPLDTVRLHVGPGAAAVARSAGAQAFTLGEHVVLGAGQTTAGTGPDRALLAHELVHVAQNRVAGAHAREIRRVPLITNCGRAEEQNIRWAQATAVQWLQHAITRLARPVDIGAELSYHFRVAASDTGNVSSIRTELESVRGELTSDAIAWNCSPATDPACTTPEGGIYAGYADALGSLSASFCGDNARTRDSGLVALLLHEALHAKRPPIPDGPYWHDPDYPGSNPLDNAEAYTHFVKGLALGILGLAEPPRPPARSGGFDISFGELEIEGALVHLRDATLYGFGLDSAVIPAEGVRQLDELLEAWRQEFPSNPVSLRVAGHADGSTSGENHALGQRRASAVADYLLEQRRRSMEPMPVHVQVISFGTGRPYRGLARGAAGHPDNRRVQVELRPYRR